MDLVSVIVPVYNSEKYLNKCLDSILNQIYKNIEIIIIDDGSTDGSLSICERYADLNKNIKLVSKKNKGVSQARNTGIDIATGEWIIFLDSDDWMEHNTIMDAITLINQNNYDTICWNYSKFINDKLINCNTIDENVLNNKNNIVSILYSIIESSYYEENYFGEYIRAPWAKMLSRKIIEDNKIRFDEKLYIGEDAMFLLEYFNNAKNVKFINKYNNIYRISSTSAVGRYKNDLDSQVIIQLKKINNLINNIEGKDIDTLKLVITKFYLNSIYELIYNYNFKGKNSKSEFNLSNFIKCTKVDITNLKLNLLSNREKLMYILVRYNQIRLLELISKMIIILKYKKYRK